MVAGASLVAALGECCGVAAKAARTLLGMPGRPLEEADFRLAGVSSVENGQLLRALRAMAERGWCETVGERWCSKPGMPAELPVFLEGAAAMRSVDGPPVRVQTIITMPGAGSCLRTALPGTGLAHAALEDTRAAFLDIASRATRSLIVLSPFLNAPGLAWAMNLFEATTAPQRELVTRSNPDLPFLLESNSTRLRALGALVLDYRLPTAEGHYETFHAKAVVADERVAYVGSANLLEYGHQSMELGVVVEGSPVHTIAALVEAVRRIAVPVDVPAAPQPAPL